MDTDCVVLIILYFYVFTLSRRGHWGLVTKHYRHTWVVPRGLVLVSMCNWLLSINIQLPFGGEACKINAEYGMDVNAVNLDMTTNWLFLENCLFDKYSIGFLANYYHDINFTSNSQYFAKFLHNILSVESCLSYSSFLPLFVSRWKRLWKVLAILL